MRDQAPALAPAPLSLLALADFRALWLSGAAFTILRWLELLAIGVHALAVTGSPLVVALMTVARMLPLTLFGVPIGALAERVDRLRLLVSAYLVMAALSLGLAMLALAGRASLPLIAIGAFASGLLWAGELPVRRVLLAELAGPPRLAPAMALESATLHATRMLGPALGGALYETFGLPGVFLLGTALYGWSALMVRRVRPIATVRAAPPGRLGAELLAGLRHLRASRLIAATVALTLIVNLFAFPYTAMIPVIGERVLGLSAFPIGLLMAGDGLGALTGALALMWLAQRRQFARIYLAGAALFLLAILAFAAASSFGVALMALIVAGLGMAGFSTMQAALVLSVAPAELRGRLMGVLTVAIGIGPLGFLAIGALASALGAPLAITVQAGTGLAMVGLCLVRFPELARPLAPSRA